MSDLINAEDSIESEHSLIINVSGTSEKITNFLNRAKGDVDMLGKICGVKAAIVDGLLTEDKKELTEEEVIDCTLSEIRNSGVPCKTCRD